MKNIKLSNAISTFKSGLNCAQAVLTAYSDDFGLDNNIALSISCGFGGGMGRLQKTCGAVTGAYMVLSIYSSGKYPENNARKEESYALIQKFSDKFKSIHGTTNCKTLLNCDINTAEGRQSAVDQGLFETVCEKCISDSILILEELTV